MKTSQTFRILAATATATAAVMTLTTLVVLPTVAAHADPASPTATITWSGPEGPVKPGTPLRVTVTGTWEADPDPDAYDEHLYVDHLINGDSHGSVPDLTTENPSVVIDIDTSEFGTARHHVKVWTEQGDIVASTVRDVVVTGEATTLRTSWPQTSRTGLDTKRAVTGSVTAPEPRSVVLQHLTNNRWQTLTADQTSDTGDFSVWIPTSWLTRHRLRVVAPATSTHVSAVSSATKTLTVTPPYNPGGSAQNYELMKWRFDPCKTVTYRLNTTRMPRGAAADIHQAFRMVGRATGLKFEYGGTSHVIPWRGSRSNRMVRPPSVSNADFLIGYATPRQVPALAGGVAGLGGPTAGTGYDSKGFVKTSEAHVALDSTSKVRGGFGRGFTRGELILHEIGHGVGLYHSMTPLQVMSYNTLDNDRFGAGDLAGLRQVGRSAGCFADKGDARQMLVEAPAPEPFRGARP